MDEQFYEQLLGRLELVFMTRKECDETMHKQHEEITQHNVDLALIKQKLDTITKINWLIFSTVVTALIAAVLVTILK